VEVVVTVVVVVELENEVEIVELVVVKETTLVPEYE